MPPKLRSGIRSIPFAAVLPPDGVPTDPPQPPRINSPADDDADLDRRCRSCACVGQQGALACEAASVWACVYALSNKRGSSVRVNVRAVHPKIGEQTATLEEKTGYPRHESGFFGNLFLPQPVSYVCAGADREKMLDFAVGSLRLCAQPSATTTASGERLSACGFIITGPCNSPSNLVVGGERFEEVVHSWLPPGLGAIDPICEQASARDKGGMRHPADGQACRLVPG